MSQRERSGLLRGDAQVLGRTGSDGAQPHPMRRWRYGLDAADVTHLKSLRSKELCRFSPAAGTKSLDGLTETSA